MWPANTVQTLFHTAAGRPSGPGALYGAARSMASEISCSVSSCHRRASGICASPLCSSSSTLAVWPKNCRKNSCAIALSSVTIPDGVLSVGTAPKALSSAGWRNLVAFQILLVLSRKPIQCARFWRRHVSWNTFLASFASCSRVGSRLYCLAAFALFLFFVYSFLSNVRSSVHHLFVYGVGFERGVC